MWVGYEVMRWEQNRSGGGIKLPHICF